MQSFAGANAKLCVGRCKALRGQMQSFAWAVAKLCVGGCKALRERWAKLKRKLSRNNSRRCLVQQPKKVTRLTTCYPRIKTVINSKFIIYI